MSSNSKSNIWGIIGIIAVLIGMVAIALPWISIENSVAVIGTSTTEITGMDMLDWESEDFQPYIPTIIAAISIISLILFAIGMASKSGKIGYVPAILGLITIILVVIEYMWISEDVQSIVPDLGILSSIYSVTISVSYGAYAALASGVLALICGIQSAKN